MSEVVAITKLLLDKLNKVLADKGIVLECKEEAIEQIAKAGYKRTLAEHTYHKRFSYLCKKIGFTKLIR